MLTTAPSTTRADVHVRPIEPADAGAAARIVYEAFAGIHDHHRFARDFPTPEAAAGLTSAFIAHPSIYGVVAEIDGRVVGSNFLDERGPIRGVGPITVDPAAQGRGAGRRLMQAVIDRGAGGAGIRLLQDAFNVRSLSLYASLGFDVAEPIALMTGRPRMAPVAAVDVRPLEDADIPEAEHLHRRVHGFERTAELRDALAAPGMAPTVAIRGDRIVAYATTLTFFPGAHAVAESDADVLALIAGTLAAQDAPASFLVPTRQARLFRSLLAMGLRVVKPMVYMTIGEYRRPNGAWIPTVLY
ncbi:MAG TPA: GNAT family N-acetyltransferase [Solirubrobacteraceae bacterium]|nr:GNAT family N-acetyltransferase [Solirubrobacteraceae bacterium]